jgi:spore maturation protein CgeB
VEEDGCFDEGVLDSPCFKKSKFFYRIDDIEFEKNKGSLAEKADILFTSNFKRNEKKEVEWLNWYSKIHEVKKEYNCFHVSSFCHLDKENIQKSNFLVLDFELESIPKVIFDAMAAKTFVLCKRPKREKEFSRIFENNIDLILFEDYSDWRKKVFIYENSPEDFSAITNNALNKMKIYHSPEERAKDIFKFYKGRANL